MDYQTLFFTNDGRINRQPFWIGSIIISVAEIFLSLVISLIFGIGGFGHSLALIVALALLYPSINLGIKRFHDRDKSGWWVLILLVPIIGAVWYFIEAGCLPGTAGPNRFGRDPLK